MQELREEQRIGWEGFGDEQQVWLRVGGNRGNRGRTRTKRQGGNGIASLVLVGFLLVGTVGLAVPVCGKQPCRWLLVSVEI